MTNSYCSVSIHFDRNSEKSIYIYIFFLINCFFIYFGVYFKHHTKLNIMSFIMNHDDVINIVSFRILIKIIFDK
jgi:hypothetical protein